MGGTRVKGGAPRLLFIGVDGASHDIVQELIGRSELPHLAGVRQRGGLGSLTSTFPPHTAPGWASIFTGVSPGEHGVYMFWELQAAQYEPRITCAGDFRWEPLWQTLAGHGLRVGSYNVPMSHPPQDLPGGYMISWPLTPALNYVIPRALLHDLVKRGFYYHSDLVSIYRGESDYAEQASAAVERRTETILYLLDAYPVDVLLVVFTELDRVSHYYWEGASRAGGEVEQAYRDIDRALGRLLDAIPEQTLVVIASDHGFGHCLANLQVGALLQEAGLLATRPLRSPRRSGGTSAPALFDDAAEAAGNAKWFEDPAAGREVDWSGTRAYMPTPGCFGINLNLRGRQRDGIVCGAAEVDAIERSLRQTVEALRWHDGDRLFDLLPREGVYAGPHIALSPDYLLMPRRWDIMPHPGLGQSLWSPPTQQGIHRLDGIVAACGPGFEGVCFDDARVEDIATTILAHLEFPLGDGVSGRVFGAPPSPAVRGPALWRGEDAKTAKRLGDTSEMERRLADMGYL